jgi:hypothetical protein
MDCPKCGGETENELEHSYFKADEVNDVSRCGLRIRVLSSIQKAWKVEGMA